MDTSVYSSNSSLHPQINNGSCHYLQTNTAIFSVWLTVYILFLPIFVFVLYIGYKRWRNQRPVSTHTDVFTFHMVFMELFNILGSCLYCGGLHTGIQPVFVAGIHLFRLTLNGQMFFHILTCVERYLAVIHPVTYQGLKQVGGVRIRNVSIGCVWLLCFGLMSVHFQMLHRSFIITLDFLGAVLPLAVVSFCSFSVLCVLIRLGPGEVGGDRKRIDQSKRRAFYTMVVIMGALVSRFMVRVGSLLLTLTTENCVLTLLSLWFNLPSSLVLPLLFLYRAGQLPGCQKKTINTD